MGKFKELFTKAQERRMNETGCSFNDAAEWVEQQSVGFLIDYTDVWEKVDEDEKPWPQLGDIYYTIDSYAWPDNIDSGIHDYTYANDHIDKNLQIMNNFFRTKEDAKFEYERLRMLHELKELSDDDQPWDNTTEHWCILCNTNMELFIIARTGFRSINEIYFKSHEAAEEAINTIGKAKIKKYLFRMNK